MLLNCFPSFRSKNCDSYHVFQNVENIVMEFVLEARARQVQILRKKDKDKPEMPQVFVFCEFLRHVLLIIMFIVKYHRGLEVTYSIC